MLVENLDFADPFKFGIVIAPTSFTFCINYVFAHTWMSISTTAFTISSYGLVSGWVASALSIMTSLANWFCNAWLCAILGHFRFKPPSIHCRCDVYNVWYWIFADIFAISVWDGLYWNDLVASLTHCITLIGDLHFLWEGLVYIYERPIFVSRSCFTLVSRFLLFSPGSVVCRVFPCLLLSSKSGLDRLLVFLFSHSDLNIKRRGRSQDSKGTLS